MSIADALVLTSFIALLVAFLARVAVPMAYPAKVEMEKLQRESEQLRHSIASLDETVQQQRLRLGKSEEDHQAVIGELREVERKLLNIEARPYLLVRELTAARTRDSRVYFAIVGRTSSNTREGLWRFRNYLVVHASSLREAHDVAERTFPTHAGFELRFMSSEGFDPADLSAAGPLFFDPTVLT